MTRWIVRKSGFGPAKVIALSDTLCTEISRKGNRMCPDAIRNELERGRKVYTPAAIYQLKTETI